MKISKNVFSVLILVIFFGALASNSFANNKSIVGMWRAIGTSEFISMQFMDNGTFSADKGEDNLYSTINGTYEVSGKTVTLTVKSNDPKVPPQASTIILTNYKVSKGNILSFIMNGNKCKFDSMK